MHIFLFKISLWLLIYCVFYSSRGIEAVSILSLQIILFLLLKLYLIQNSFFLAFKSEKKNPFRIHSKQKMLVLIRYQKTSNMEEGEVCLSYFL